MALSQPVQSGSNDLQRELLTSRYSKTAPLEPVLPGTKTAAPKAEEKHAVASQDWFERSTDKADGGRTALKNLLTRMKSLADAAAQREAAERVGVAPEATEEGTSALPAASTFAPPAASWAAPNTSGSTAASTGSGSSATPPDSGSGTTSSGSETTSGSGSSGNTPSGQGQGLLNKLLG
jgi:hypothetical protein